jgi:hypothetical protein
MVHRKTAQRKMNILDTHRQQRGQARREAKSYRN